MRYTYRYCCANANTKKVENIIYVFLPFAAWIASVDKSIYKVIPGTAFLLDCQLNDPNVQVKLYKKDRGTSFMEVNPQTDQHVTQNGQNFSIILTGNKMTVQCKATGQDGQIVPEPKELVLQKARGGNIVILYCIIFLFTCIIFPVTINLSCKVKKLLMLPWLPVAWT